MASYPDGDDLYPLAHLLPDGRVLMSTASVWQVLGAGCQRADVDLVWSLFQPGFDGLPPNLRPAWNCDLGLRHAAAGVQQSAHDDDLGG